jgi:lipoprotein-anchoring transpeptidase ErfK/SrfK
MGGHWTVATAFHMTTARAALLTGAAALLIVGMMPAQAAILDRSAAAKSAVRSKAAKPAKEEAPKGQLQIVVSIANQHVTLYADGTRVGQGPVSTGIPGKPTPTGVFSIIQKDRYHHSNLYSNAPMPFMERITWSGVALHEGPLPGYPASHGCIRMTHDFALRLWGLTKLGVRVIVSHSEVVPVAFAHPNLFTPKSKPTDAPVADDQPEKHADALTPVVLAQATGAAQATDAPTPLRGTLDSSAEPATTGTTPAPAAATPAADVSGSANAGTPAAAVVQSAPAVEDPAKGGAVDDPLKTPPAKTAPGGKPPAQQAVKHSGHLAVFISRREKRLYVREGFEPLFDMPVEIDHPEQPFGTHVFTALALTDDGAGMRWNLMSMPGDAPRMASPRGRKGQPVAQVQQVAPQSAAQVLDRIQIPQEARDRIGELLTPGSSLVVSDQGLGGETGQGTDFIVLTR